MSISLIRKLRLREMTELVQAHTVQSSHGGIQIQESPSTELHQAAFQPLLVITISFILPPSFFFGLLLIQHSTCLKSNTFP